MPVAEPTGIHCSYCNGLVLRHREWGACWLECESCGCQKPIARIQSYLAAVARQTPPVQQAREASAGRQPTVKMLPRGAVPSAACPPRKRARGRELRPAINGKTRSVSAGAHR